MRYQVSRLMIPLVALLLGAGSATVSNAASAPVSKPVTFTSAYSYFPLLQDRYVFPAQNEQYVAVLSATFTMNPGEVRRVTDQLDVRIPAGHNPELNNLVSCYDQTGHQIESNSSGTNYTAGGNAYQWNVSMLITAPAKNPTENYLCLISTYASGRDTGYRMSVLAPTPGETTYGTWLEVSAANQPGAQEWWFNNCDSSDSTGTCSYIGGASHLGNPTAIDVFSPADVWTAGDDATTIDGAATFQITSCYTGTQSCRTGEHGSGAGYSIGGSYLTIDQLYPDGSVCQVNRAYSEQTIGGALFLTESYDISNAQHHWPLYYHLSAPVSQLCRGSRQFAIDLHIWWTGGNPVKIDGGSVNVLNSVRATTTTVPDVIGLTQVQADRAIRAAGLTAAAPAYVTATAPPGTVLSQNSPGGTIEPAGSTVQLTISRGPSAVLSARDPSLTHIWYEREPPAMPAAEPANRPIGLARGRRPPARTGHHHARARFPAADDRRGARLVRRRDPAGRRRHPGPAQQRRSLCPGAHDQTAGRRVCVRRRDTAAGQRRDTGQPRAVLRLHRAEGRRERPAPALDPVVG
jgi:hypothetical protein